MKWTPYPHQQIALNHVLEHAAEDTKSAGLLLDMGLGKTVVTLSAIDILQSERFEVKKVLVIAPKKVTEVVWRDEIAKWDHLKHLRLSVVLGTEKQRKEALAKKADIYAINREMVAWLVAHYRSKWPFDMVVIDESSSFKNHDSLRFKAIRKNIPLIKRMVILTGTPIPNGLLDIWAQIYLLDRGKRLSVSFADYKDKYFQKGEKHRYEIVIKGLKDDGILGKGIYEKEIYEKVGDVCIAMKSVDYLKLPGIINHAVKVPLSAEVRAQYEKFEQELVLSLDDKEITALNAANLTGKLLQFASGAVYTDEKEYAVIHDAKIEVLQELVEQANGKPMLIAYWFKHDYDRIVRALKAYSPVDMKSKGVYEAWNKGEVQVALGHPQSVGHGLNLQHGGHLCTWFSSTYNLEAYQQFNKRLDRPGQLHTVQNYRLIAEGTIDEKAVAVLDGKANAQDALLNYVRDLRLKWGR